jgi:hypothetical protein
MKSNTVESASTQDSIYLKSVSKLTRSIRNLLRQCYDTIHPIQSMSLPTVYYPRWPFCLWISGVCILSAPLLVGDLLFVYYPFRTWRQIIACRSSNPPRQPDATDQPNFNFALCSPDSRLRQSHSKGEMNDLFGFWFPRGCSSALNTPQYEIRDACCPDWWYSRGDIGRWIRRWCNVFYYPVSMASPMVLGWCWTLTVMIVLHHPWMRRGGELWGMTMVVDVTKSNMDGPRDLSSLFYRGISPSGLLCFA